jgi:4'-phosphopantetheinyl transferase
MYRFYFNCHRWKPTYNQWIYANRCLPIDEIQRIDQYAFQRDVKFTLIGQLLIRYLLNRIFHEKSSSFSIERTKSNRPFIRSIPSFDFNLSHQNQLVCIAGTFHGQIGCDTMIYKKRNYELFKKKFHLNEYKLIEKNPLNFSRLWCLKESYVKYLGIGIPFQLSRLNFHLQTKDFSKNNIISDTILEIDNQLNNNNNNIRFDEQILNLSNNEQQLITLCLSNNNPCQSFIELNIDDILHACTPFDENKQNNLISSWERFQMKRQIDISKI